MTWKRTILAFLTYMLNVVIRPKQCLNSENTFNEPDIHVIDAKYAVACTPLDDKSAETDVHPVLNAENNESPLDSSNLQNILINQSSAVAILVSPGEVTLECEQDKAETLHNGLLCNDKEQNLSINSNGEPLPGVDSVSVDSHLAEDVLPVSESKLNIENIIPKDNSEPQAFKNLDPVEAADDSCSLNHAPPSGADCQLGSTGILELENVETKACNVPHHFKNLNLVSPDEKQCTQIHVLLPCSSPPNQPNVLPPEDGILVENAHDFLSREIELCASETPGKEIAAVQGEEGCSADVTGTSLEVKQTVSSDLNKSDEFVGDAISKDNQLETLNCLESSEFPAPETLLSAPEGVPYLSNDLVGQSGADKEALTQREGSVVDLKNLSGKKRRSMESTPVLQEGNLAKSSAMARFLRSMDDIPDDDDIFASILVGKRSSVLKMRPTPPPLEIASAKRPRVTPRVNVPKRKTLLDDSMVLHGDAIRQQLTNTEDIRRIRRKAPCTRPEIWLIQKYLLEDEIFSEPLFTGMSAELTGLLNQTYTMINAGGDSILSPSEVMEDLELSRSVEPVKCFGEPVETMTDKNDGEALEPAETFLQTDNNTLLCNTNNQTEALNGIVFDSSKDGQPLEIASRSIDDIVFDSSKDGQSLEIASMTIEKPVNGVDVASTAAINGADLPISAAPHSEDDCNSSADYRIDSTAVDENHRTEAIPQKNDDVSCSSQDEKLVIHHPNELGELNDETSCLGESRTIEKDDSIMDIVKGRVADAIEVAEVGDETSVVVEGASIARDASDMENIDGGNSVDVGFLQECHADVGDIANDRKLVPMPDNCLEETGAGMLVNLSTTMNNENPSVPDVTAESSDPADAAVVAVEEIGKRELDVMIEGGVMDEKGADGEGKFSSRHNCTEGTQMDSSGQLESNTDVEIVPIDGGENLGCQAVNQECDIDVESTAVRDSGDFGNIMDDNDTEFLNVDDEAEPEVEEDNDMPSAVEDRFLENSGWSSRTRAVAKYLKSLFDNEAGRGRKTLPVDHLLAGKSRKEASRMFFETLVLKSKDYIQVEQGNPFENINIQPRLKLMKSEF